MPVRHESSGPPTRARVTMTQSIRMASFRGYCSLVLLSAALAPAQVDENYEPPGQHPALLLNAKRLRLLRRERERQSQRWEQFDTLMKGNARMPEPGFALALYYQVSGDQNAAKRAIDWALSEGADLRQRSLVYDWCVETAPEKQAAQLAALLTRALERPPQANGIPEARSRAFAAMAIAGNSPQLAEREIRRIVVTWFRGDLAQALQQGRDVVPRSDLYALLELLHAVRDNVIIDLRESARAWFRLLPVWDLLSYYPASYPAPENEYRIPAVKGGEPDPHLASLARAADLALVAYDTNALDYQFLQGWLMHDRFNMRSTFAAPYEFLWANPYQPGLSYYNAPLSIHDDVLGRLFVRSSWDDDARWAGYLDGQLQVFEDGAVTVAGPKASHPLRVGETVIANAVAPAWPVFESPLERLFLVGLRPRRQIVIEPDHHELMEQRADPGGIVQVEFPNGFKGSIRVRER